MAKREIELTLKRGRLQERIAQQRTTIAAQMVPIAGVLATADRTINAGRMSVNYVKRNPIQIGVAVTLIALFRPRRVWRWGRRALVIWTLWHKASGKLTKTGLLEKLKEFARR